MYKTMFKVIAIVGCGFGSTAFAIDHDETFPRMLEMVTSASPAELEAIEQPHLTGPY